MARKKGKGKSPKPIGKGSATACKREHDESKTNRYRELRLRVRVDRDGRPIADNPISNGLAANDNLLAQTIASFNKPDSKPIPDNVVSFRDAQQAKAASEKPEQVVYTTSGKTNGVGTLASEINALKRMHNQAKQQKWWKPAKYYRKKYGVDPVARNAEIDRQWDARLKRRLTSDLKQQEHELGQQRKRAARQQQLEDAFMAYDERAEEIVRDTNAAVGRWFHTDHEIIRGRLGEPIKRYHTKAVVPALAPSGAPIAQFLKGGKHAPPEQEVVYTTLKPDKATELVSTKALIGWAVNNIEVQDWPAWLGKLTEWENDKPIVLSGLLNALDDHEENRLLRQLLDVTQNLLYKVQEKNKDLEQEAWDANQATSLMEWELAHRIDEDSNESVDKIKSSHERMADTIYHTQNANRKLAERVKQLEQGNATPNSPPANLSVALSEHRTFMSLFVNQGSMLTFARYVYGDKEYGIKMAEHQSLLRQKETEQRRAEHARKLLAMRANTNRYRAALRLHLGTEVSALHRIAENVNKAFKRSRQYEHDLAVFKQWSSRVVYTASSPDEVRNRLMSIDRAINRRKRRADNHYVKWWERNIDKATVQYVSAHTVHGKVATAVKDSWNSFADWFNTPIGREERLALKRRKRIKLRKKQAKVVGSAMNQLGAVVRAAAEQDKVAAKAAARKAYRIAH